MKRISTVGLCLVAIVAFGATLAASSYAGECSELGPVCEPPITSGVAIQSEGGARCTAGPLAVNPTDKGPKFRLLTAGHCIKNGGPEGTVIGETGGRGRPEEKLENPECTAGKVKKGIAKPKVPWQGERWFTANTFFEKVEIGRAGSYADTVKEDYGEICIENPNWMPELPLTAEWNLLPEQRYLVTGLVPPIQGLMSCHEGATTKQSCGQVEEEPWKNGNIKTEFFKVAGPALKGEKGDSGGPCLANANPGLGGPENPEKGGPALMQGIFVRLKPGKEPEKPEFAVCQDLTEALKKLKLVS